MLCLIYLESLTIILNININNLNHAPVTHRVLMNHTLFKCKENKVEVKVFSIAAFICRIKDFVVFPTSFKQFGLTNISCQTVIN